MRWECRLVGAVLFGVSIAACAETTTIRSYPPGSKVFIDGQLAGVTPFGYRVAREEMGRAFHVRLEREGFQPTEASLQKVTCPGRVVGGIFTFGILFLFKGSTCFVGVHDFSLMEEDGYAGSRRGQPSAESRLQRLEQLRQNGTITDEEFHRYREGVLRELVRPGVP
jgi:hypothetical protein